MIVDVCVDVEKVVRGTELAVYQRVSMAADIVRNVSMKNVGEEERRRSIA